MTFTETHQSRNAAAADGFVDRDDRAVFMTDELTSDVRVSGTSSVRLRAQVDGEDASFSA